MVSLWILFVSVPLVVTNALPTDFEAKVEDLVTNVFMPKNGNPGLGLTFVTTDGLYKLARGYGFSDIEKQIPLTNTSLFAIASISKSFAATLVGRVLNEKFPDLGESVLDAPVTELGPQLNITFVDRVRAEGTSFRDILSHRTCLSTNTLGRTMGYFSNREEFVYRSRYIPSICPYRTGYNYNNNMFGLVGELIAAINGTTYETMLLNFLSEIGMVNSKVLNRTEDYETLANFPTPYYKDESGELLPFNPKLIRRGFLTLGSSGVVTSPEDFANYLLLRLNNGRLNGRQVVPAEVMNWVKRPTNPFNFRGYGSGSSNVNGDFAYALGLNNGFYEGYQLISHDGYWAPFASRMSLYPSLGFGIFSSTSGPGRLSTGLDTLHNAIASLVVGTKSFDDVKAELAMSTKGFEPGVPRGSDQPCQKCIQISGPEAAGVFGNPFHGELEVIYNATDPVSPLRLEYGIWGQAQLVSTSSNGFNVRWETDIVHDFLAASGTVPNHTVEYIDADTLILNYDGRLEFKRNANLGTLPEIPWESGCDKGCSVSDGGFSTFWGSGTSPVLASCDGHDIVN